jgi:hypothetical protein
LAKSSALLLSSLVSFPLRLRFDPRQGNLQMALLLAGLPRFLRTAPSVLVLKPAQRSSIRWW